MHKIAILCLVACGISSIHGTRCTSHVEFAYYPILPRGHFGRPGPFLDCGFSARRGHSYATRVPSSATIHCTDASVPIDYPSYQPVVRNQILKITNSTIKYLPDSSFENFSYVQKLFVNNVGIEEASEGAFDGLVKLKELHMDSNQLEEMPRRLRSVEVLSLNHNRIKKLHRDSFKGLNKLKRLFLSGNAIQTVNPPLPKLDLLDLSDNELSRLVHTDCAELNLDNNSITVVEAIGPEVVRLSLRYNKIHTLGDSPAARSLQVLDLGHNEITKLGRLGSMPRLQKLLLDHNHIDAIADHAFANLPALNTLDLAHNKLKEFTPDALGSLGRLVLAHNHLTSLDVSNLDNLYALLIDHNRLSDVDLPKRLRYITVMGNRWSCESLAKISEEKAGIKVGDGFDIACEDK